jgi:hypothetical protein
MRPCFLCARQAGVAMDLATGFLHTRRVGTVGDHWCGWPGRWRLRSAHDGDTELGVDGGVASGEVRAMTAVGPDGVGSSNRTDMGATAAEVGVDGAGRIRAGGGSSSNGTAGCGAGINVNCCSLTTCCRSGWSTGSTSIDMGCCSSLIHCRPGWGAGSLSIDVGCCLSPIRCRSRWSAGINVTCCSSMTSCGSGWRAGISYVAVVMASIL